MATTEEAVAAIAEVMADAESKAANIRHAARDAKAAFQDIHDNGDAGYLRSKAFATELDTVATAFEADLFDLHARMTEYAQERGIDLPGIEGGGGR